MTTVSVFSRVLGSDKRNLTPAEGVTGLAFAAVTADRRIEPEEVKEVASRLNDLEIFEGIGKAKLVKAAKKIFEIAEERDQETLVRRSIQAVPAHLRVDAFRTASHVVAADRQVTDEERELLDRIRNDLELTDAEAEPILDRAGV